MISKFKKVSVGLMLTSVLVAIVPQTTYANLHLSNKEVQAPSIWAKADIEKSIKIGLIPKKVQGNYKEGITREEFSELAVNLYENLSKREVSVQIKNPFVDTRDLNAIKANQLGIIKGKGEGIFDPYEEMTREEVALVLYNTLKASKPRYNYEESYKSGFKDDNKISSWAKEAVGYLYAIEVIDGNHENIFDPKGNSTREDAIILVKRTYDKVMASERTSRGQMTISRGNIREEEDSKQAELKKIISAELGKPYKWGATGPNSYDCSGFTYATFGKLGIKLGRTSRSQINNGTPVAKKDLQYGDLVLFARDGKNINHVGIYVGDGKFVHSPQTGDVVKITTLTSGYYANSYYAARRLY